MTRKLMITKKERKNLESWKKREGWTGEKSFNGLFDFGDSMPVNLVAPNTKGSWSGEGKCVCVMGGYATTVTNVHRRCPEMPVTAELIRPEYCYTHETVHFVERDGKKIPTTHKGINMVLVS